MENEPSSTDTLKQKGVAQTGQKKFFYIEFPVKCPRKKCYVCRVCQTRFSSTMQLNSHLTIHTPHKLYTSQVTSERTATRQFYNFERLSSLNSHLETHSTRRYKPYTCTECQSSFSMQICLKRHLRIHTGEKPFACGFCKKAFLWKGNLKAHIRVHTGERPYVCDVCHKAFTQQGSLKKHIETLHTGKKPHVCAICDKAFAQSSGLSYHMRTHTGEKPYVCDVCQKAFRGKSVLNQHLCIRPVR